MHNRLIEPDLNRLRDTLLVMGGAAERAIALSIRALVNRDSELAEQVIREDDAIDRMEVEIDGLCVDLLALKHGTLLAQSLPIFVTQLGIRRNDFFQGR